MNKAIQKIKIMDEIGLPKKQVFTTYDKKKNNTGIALKKNYKLHPSKSVVKIPTEELKKAKTIVSNYIPADTVDVHPIAVLYYMKINKLGKKGEHSIDCSEWWVDHIEYVRNENNRMYLKLNYGGEEIFFEAN